jgi:hypothetical protein
MEARILKHWDEGNAYRLEILHVEEEVWAPLDTDEYVKLG